MESTKSTWAEAASQIRGILKDKFPKTKFKVRSEAYSLGTSISVSWIDGPTQHEVNDAIGQYQKGHFDGMTDSYDYSNKRDDIPQVKFISCTRRISDALRNDTEARIRAYYAMDVDHVNSKDHIDVIVYRALETPDQYTHLWEDKKVEATA